MNIVKAALITNFKLLEMMQIMGASSFELAKNISQKFNKKNLTWSIIELIFVFFISIILINLFGANFEFYDSSFSRSLFFQAFLF